MQIFLSPFLLIVPVSIDLKKAVWLVPQMSVLGNEALLIGGKTSNLDNRLELYPLLAVSTGPAHFTSMSLSFLLSFPSKSIAHLRGRFWGVNKITLVESSN